MTSAGDQAMGSFTYEVARQEPEEAHGDLCRLWTENLQLEGRAEDRFRWLYRDAPHSSSSTTDGCVFLLRAVAKNDGDQVVVGTSGLTVRKFQIGERGGRAALNGDLAVDKVHRGLLPALRLMKAACEHERASFDVAYGFPNAKAVGVLLRAGFRVLAKTTRYVRILRHAPYHRRLGQRPSIPPIVVRAASNPVVAHALGPVVDVARLGLGAVSIAKARRRYKLAWSKRFDGRFDDLWSAAHAEYDVLAERSSAFLSWRYPASSQIEIAVLTRRSDNVVTAYAIVEHDKASRAAHIRDIFGHKEDLGALVDMLLPSLWRRGAVAVSVRFVGAPYFAEIIRARAFEARPAEQRTITIALGDQTSESDKKRLTDANAWHLFDLDEDA